MKSMTHAIDPTRRLHPLTALSALLLALLLAGCAGMRQQASTIPDAKPRWSYGNHCGGGYPNQTARPPVADDLDLACALHDACYDILARPMQICDALLVYNVRHLRESNDAGHFPWHCRQLFEEVVVYATLAPSSREDVLALGFDVLGVVVASPRHALTQVQAGILGRLAGRQHERCNGSDKALTFIAPLDRSELQAFQAAVEAMPGARQLSSEALLQQLRACHLRGCAGFPLRSAMPPRAAVPG